MFTRFKCLRNWEYMKMEDAVMELGAERLELTPLTARHVAIFVRT